MTIIYDFHAQALNGTPIDFAQYRGKVLLIVNTASKCGFTPQYQGLEQIHRRFHEQGMQVLGFPCNQFGAQEPGMASEIGQFCEKNFGVSFPLFSKVDVNGETAHPLFKFLKQEAPGVLGTQRIKWNFTKFLVKKDGSVYKRYGSVTRPETLAADIQKLLAE